MKKSKKLFLAWIAFIAVVVLFIVAVETYHHFRKECSFSCQYRILIDQNSVIENEEAEAPPQEQINPDDKFYEQTKYGCLPKISKDGARPFDEYSAYSEISSKKELRVVVLVGCEDKISPEISLKNQKITFIVPYYMNKLEDTVKAIRENGCEFFLQMPTQSSVSPDKKGIVPTFLANADLEETLNKLFHLLASTKYALGIANVSPTLLTKSQNVMIAISNELTRRGLAFLDLEKSNDLLKDAEEKDGLIYINTKKAFEDGFDISRLNDGDIITVRLENLDSLMKALPSDWLLTPVSASVKKNNVVL